MRIIRNLVFSALFLGFFTTYCGFNTTIAYSQNMKGFAMQNNTTSNLTPVEVARRAGELHLIRQKLRTDLLLVLLERKASMVSKCAAVKARNERVNAQIDVCKSVEEAGRLALAMEQAAAKAKAEQAAAKAKAEADAKAEAEARDQRRATYKAIKLAKQAQAKAKRAQAEIKHAANEAKLRAIKDAARKFFLAMGFDKPKFNTPVIHPEVIKTEKAARKAERKARRQAQVEEAANLAKSNEIKDVEVEYFDDFDFETEVEVGGDIVGFISKVADKFNKTPLGRLMNVSMVTPVAGSKLQDTQREKRAAGSKSLMQDDIHALTQSTGYNVLPCIRFGKTKKGTPNTSPGAEIHSREEELKSTATRLSLKGGAGRFLAAFNTTVTKILGGLNLEISADNAILYEVDDINSSDLMKSVADILLDSGYVSICRGFAVKIGTELGDAFVSLMDEMFRDAVEQRGYARSVITTPNQAELAHGIPTFSGDLAQYGWIGNDGGTVFTNHLMTAIQNRARTIDLGGDDSKSKGLFKGLATAAKLVTKFNDDGTYDAYNYAYDTAVDKAVKQVMKNLKKHTVLERINAADKAMLKLIPGIGNATADAIIDERDKAGEFASFDDLVTRVSKSAPKVKRFLKDIEVKCCWLQYMFEVEGVTYCVSMYLEKDQNKGRKTNFPSKGLKLEGLQGIDVYNWAISLDAPMDQAKISLGWQVTQLVDEQFVRDVLAKGEAGYKELSKIFGDMLGKQNKLMANFSEMLQGDKDSAIAKTAQQAQAMMQLLGKKTTERISSGFGVKAGSKYVQMIDLGQEVFIDRLSGRNWRKFAFFGRTPNQGHDTIRHAKALDIGFVAELLDAYFRADDKSSLEKVFEKFTDKTKQGLSKRQEAILFIKSVHDKHGDVIGDGVLMFLRAMLPTVAEGAIIVDTGLQEAVCGDNDGDRNMVSYSPLLVLIAKNIRSKHPKVLPAKEQSKAFVINAFSDAVVKEGGFKKAYDLAKEGNLDDLRQVQRFLNAPGNSPGQDNVGGPTLSAAAPLNFHPWAYADGKKHSYNPINPAARKYMDFLYALQQTGIDLQKYERLTHSVEYWYEGEYSKEGWILPGKYVPGKQWVVTKGKTCYGANLTKDEAAKLAAETGGEARDCPNHFPIYGMRDATFTDYKNASLDTWESAAEYVPLMVWSASRPKAKLRNPMWDNGALYNHAAWTVSAINMGLPYLTFEQMSELQFLFDCSKKVPVADWVGLAEWFSEFRTNMGLGAVTPEQVEHFWVWPSMVGSYQKLSYRKDNSSSPGVFSTMRSRIADIYVDVCDSKNITILENPTSTLAHCGFDDIIVANCANKKYIPHYDGWKAEQIVRSMYYAYIDVAMSAAESKSQSEKTQIDQASSGSDMKQYLRAALSANGFLVTQTDQLQYMREWSRTWRQALSVRVLERQDKVDALGGMMVLGLRALKSMYSRPQTEVELAVKFVAELCKSNTTTFMVDIMGSWSAFKEWSDKNFEGENPPMLKVVKSRSEMIKLHKAYKEAQKICALDSVKEYFISLNSVSDAEEDQIFIVASQDSDEFNDRLSEWIVTEYFGALDEAFEDLDRAENRQDSIDRILELVEKAKYGESIVSDIQKMLGKDLSVYVQAQARDMAIPVTSADDIFDFYRKNRSSILAGFKQYASPIVQLGRLVEYANKVIVVGDIEDQAFIDAQFKAIVEEGIFEVADDGTRSVRSVVEFPVPERIKVDVGHNALLAGHNLEFLTQVPRLGASRRADEDRCEMDTTVVTTWGYIFVDSVMYQLALDAHGSYETKQWLRAQFECGVGHVTTADYLFAAYGLWTYKQSQTKEFCDRIEDQAWAMSTLGLNKESFRAYHANCPVSVDDDREAVMKVQETFMTMYPHAIVIDMGYKDAANVADPSKDPNPAKASLLHDMALVKTVWMPTFYGAKSKSNKLFLADLKENKALPTNLYRHYGFVMAGHADRQSGKGAAPKEVLDFMKQAYGGTYVGVVKKSSRSSSSYGNSMDKYSFVAGVTKNQEQQAAAKDTMFHSNFEQWVSNGGWEDGHTGCGGDISRYFSQEITCDKGLTLPSPIDTSIKGLDLLENHEDSWRSMGYLCLLSPSLMFCLNGIATQPSSELEDGEEQEDMMIRMKFSVKNQSVSSIRGLFGQITRTYGVDTVLEGVNTPPNPSWDKESMKTMLIKYSGMKA